jgi:hypothetical protein
VNESGASTVEADRTVGEGKRSASKELCIELTERGVPLGLTCEFRFP